MDQPETAVSSWLLSLQRAASLGRRKGVEGNLHLRKPRRAGSSTRAAIGTRRARNRLPCRSTTGSKSSQPSRPGAGNTIQAVVGTPRGEDGDVGSRRGVFPACRQAHTLSLARSSGSTSEEGRTRFVSRPFELVELVLRHILPWKRVVQWFDCGKAKARFEDRGHTLRVLGVKSQRERISRSYPCPSWLFPSQASRKGVGLVPHQVRHIVRPPAGGMVHGEDDDGLRVVTVRTTYGGMMSLRVKSQRPDGRVSGSPEADLWLCGSQRRCLGRR